MSKDFHHGQKSRQQKPNKKREPSWEQSKIRHTVTKQRREDTLRHAVRNGDVEALEDYDEPEYE